MGSVFSLRIKDHLEPLAITANVTQSAFCRVDEVLLMFGALTLQYQNLRTTHGDQTACDAILNGLKKRWLNTDQDTFIAAVVLNPFFKHRPFKPLQRFRPASIYELFITLWTRFFPNEDPPLVALYQNVIDYMRETGDFMMLQTSVTACLHISVQKVIYFTAEADTYPRENPLILASCLIHLRLLASHQIRRCQSSSSHATFSQYA